MAMSQLSQRENEVFELAILGLSNDEIASRLAISRRTVETHLRTVFHKTGVTRRAQLIALFREGGPPATAQSGDDPPARSAEPAGAPAGPRGRDDERVRLYEAAVRRLVDRQFPLFEERVELTVIVGERDGQDSVVERRWTTPKPYLVHRMLRPIVAWTQDAASDPESLSLTCDVHGHDIHTDVSPMLEPDGRPLVMVLFQPGLQTVTEWTLSYRAPGLWDPLRATGADTLWWATATVDGRHRPMMDELTVKVVYPAGGENCRLVEDENRGTATTERLRSGQTQVSWHDRTPVAAEYSWALTVERRES